MEGSCSYLEEMISVVCILVIEIKSGVIRFRREEVDRRRDEIPTSQVEFIGRCPIKADRSDRNLFICGGPILCAVQPRNPANPRLVVNKERRSGTLLFASGT